MTPRRIRFKQAQEAKNAQKIQAKIERERAQAWEAAKAKAVQDRLKRK